MEIKRHGFYRPTVTLNGDPFSNVSYKDFRDFYIVANPDDIRFFDSLTSVEIPAYEIAIGLPRMKQREIFHGDTRQHKNVWFGQWTI